MEERNIKIVRDPPEVTLIHFWYIIRMLGKSLLLLFAVVSVHVTYIAGNIKYPWYNFET